MMATIVIDKNAPKAKKSVIRNRTIPFTEGKREDEDTADPEFNLYESLNSAFADMRLMMDGKKRKKTLDELIDELRNSND